MAKAVSLKSRDHRNASLSGKLPWDCNRVLYTRPPPVVRNVLSLVGVPLR